MTDGDGVHSYGYDNLNRLVSASHPVNSLIATQNESFGYDAVGNRTSDANISGFQYDAANRLIANSKFSYGYDGNGNQTSRTSASRATGFAYNVDNMMTQASLPDGTQWNYKQDVWGVRIEKSSGTAASQVVRYVYDGPNVLAALDGNNSVTAMFTDGPGIAEPLMMRRADGSEVFLHADGLGSIVAETDASGNEVERIEYEAYGKPVFVDVRGALVVSSQSVTEARLPILDWCTILRRCCIGRCGGRIIPEKGGPCRKTRFGWRGGM